MKNNRNITNNNNSSSKPIKDSSPSPPSRSPELKRLKDLAPVDELSILPPQVHEPVYLKTYQESLSEANIKKIAYYNVRHSLNLGDIDHKSKLVEVLGVLKDFGERSGYNTGNGVEEEEED